MSRHSTMIRTWNGPKGWLPMISATSTDLDIAHRRLLLAATIAKPNGDWQRQFSHQAAGNSELGGRRLRQAWARQVPCKIDKVLAGYRLCQGCRCAALERRVAELRRIIHSRNRDNRHIAQFDPQPTDQLEAVHLRQHNICDDQIDMPSRGTGTRRSHRAWLSSPRTRPAPAFDRACRARRSHPRREGLWGERCNRGT